MNKKEKSKAAYDFWESIGNPKTALAPMVDVCDLPFRILCRRYGTQLTYTQMYNASHFSSSDSYRAIGLKEVNKELDYPFIFQLAGHDPEMLLQSARYVENVAPCIDLNLGCPQMIAKHGHYGAFLLDHPDEVYKIVGYLCNNVKCAFSCKIRLFNDLNKTYELCKKLEELGIKLLCVHGRTKEQNKEKVGAVNWEAIRIIKEMMSIPVIANGGLGTFEDIDKCFEVTKCDCVMSGEKLIEMPSFFSKKMVDIDDIGIEYLDIWKKYREDLNDNLSIIRGHMFKFYYAACKGNNELNQSIANTKNIEDCYEIAKKIKEERKNVNIEDKYKWYFRHKNKNKEKKDNMINENNFMEDANDDNNLDGFF